MVSAKRFMFFLRGKILFTGALFPFSNQEIVTFKDKRKSFNYSDSCISYKNSGGGKYRPIWPLRGCAAGQGMIFYLSLLNRVYNFV